MSAHHTSEIDIRLNPDIVVKKYAEIFATTGRVHIPDILTPESAARIHEALTTEVPWQTNFNDGEKGYTLHKIQVEAMTEVQRNLLNTHITEKAKYGFQYIYNSYSLSDARAQKLNQDLFINRVLDFVNSEAFLDFMRAVTGFQEATYADAQCTLFRPGHFLTDHSDDVGGKNRLAAYVLNFTPHWRPDWGGILQFIDNHGHISQGFTPTFNALNILKVPQKHSVSYVAPQAEGGRYSITGWLRKGEPEQL
ncbi:2OG-Fe(II) oxygenase [Luteithermobacter gelatinilyticus]|uniref:2OG-Fe(II) oxygenase n=1 Tax=Luteithermobacter gelatinilyticus TaxID=2582913 RepID=UPI00143CCB38|nr:2OG-Fe(II) oxygenase family protein [Luteithermobacter gelatinilyticus]|tara:strand:+ start:3513 stop:4265 length:753 start_codon:yes stop_codon:yes gene_type:complete